MASPGSHKEKIAIAEDKLQFKYLPAYASFILNNKLDEYVREQLKYSFEEQIPILRFFTHLSDEELFNLSKASTTELLTMLAENRGKEFIDKSTGEYITNRIPTIEREQVVSQDITIASFLRRKTLRKFLEYYTQEFKDFILIMEEVDRFVAESEDALFSAYINIQQEQIRWYNHELERKQEDLLEAQELADMGSFIWDLTGKNSVFTPGVLKIFEMTKTSNLEEFMTQVHEEDKAMLQAALDKAIKKDGLYECEYRFVKDGKEKRIWSRGIVDFKDGVAVSMKGTLMDVTNKYTILNQLQESEKANKLAQALTHIGNWTWDIHSGKITWSDELYRIYGLEPQSEKITFERFLSFVHPDDREKRRSDLQETLKTLKVNDYTMRIITAKGETKVLKGKGEMLTDKNNRPLILNGTCQDITFEHQLNEEIHEKEKYLQELINNAPDAVIVLDETNTISLWNPKAQDIFGWTTEEVLGRSLPDTILLGDTHKEHKSGLMRLIKSGIPKHLNKTLEMNAIHKNGREFYISITISQYSLQGKSSFICFIRDISEDRKTKEELNLKSRQLERLNVSLEAKNNELLRINKELESFNYIASHDLQEPLRKIQTFTQLIVEKAEGKLPPSTVEYFNKIRTSSARMKVLIEDLLMFSQTTANEDNFEPTDMNMVLDEVKIILSTVIEEKKVVIKSDALPELKVIPFQVQQLFLNLISNAIKYSKEQTAPRIRISNRIVRGTQVKDEKALPGKEYYEFRFEDNGIGFEEENAEKIFGLFQRLHNKDKYSGTGIGLAICKKIVNNHNGFIRAESSLGKGSVFYVYFPKDDGLPKKTNYLVN